MRKSAGTFTGKDGARHCQQEHAVCLLRAYGTQSHLDPFAHHTATGCRLALDMASWVLAGCQSFETVHSRAFPALRLIAPI